MKPKHYKRLTLTLPIAAYALPIAALVMPNAVQVSCADDPAPVARKAGKSGKASALLDKSQMTSAPLSYAKTFQDAKLDASSSNEVPETSNARLPRSNKDMSAWNGETYCWHSPAFCYQPLYFEQPALERYGIKARPVLNPIISSGHFYVSVFALPWHVVKNRPWDCTCTLGQMRPGNCKTPSTAVSYAFPSQSYTSLECAPSTPEFAVTEYVSTVSGMELTVDAPLATTTAGYFPPNSEGIVVQNPFKKPGVVSVKLHD